MKIKTEWLHIVTKENKNIDIKLGCKEINPDHSLLTDAVCTIGAISKWHKYNCELPARIIVYRDGVADGQLKMVVDYEVPQLLSVLTELTTNYR